jgi:hypothetical protein
MSEADTFGRNVMAPKEGEKGELVMIVNLVVDEEVRTTTMEGGPFERETGLSRLISPFTEPFQLCTSRSKIG